MQHDGILLSTPRANTGLVTVKGAHLATWVKYPGRLWLAGSLAVGIHPLPFQRPSAHIPIRSPTWFSQRDNSGIPECCSCWCLCMCSLSSQPALIIARMTRICSQGAPAASTMAVIAHRPSTTRHPAPSAP